MMRELLTLFFSLTSTKFVHPTPPAMDVYLRIRPPPKSEVATGAVPIVSVHPELGEVTICDPASIGEESR